VGLKEADQAPLCVTAALDVAFCCRERAMAGELLNIAQGAPSSRQDPGGSGNEGPATGMRGAANEA